MTDQSPATIADKMAWVYPLLVILFAFSPLFVYVWKENAKPIKEPESFIGDRVVKVQRGSVAGELIFTSRDGRIAKTRDFKNWTWLQK